MAWYVKCNTPPTRGRGESCQIRLITSFFSVIPVQLSPWAKRRSGIQHKKLRAALKRSGDWPEGQSSCAGFRISDALARNGFRNDGLCEVISRIWYNPLAPFPGVHGGDPLFDGGYAFGLVEEGDVTAIGDGDGAHCFVAALHFLNGFGAEEIGILAAQNQ